MISFYPGPSRVEEKVPEYVQDAYEKGILSINHRSEEFMELYAGTVDVLKKRLDIPQEYSIFFTTSATECWEIIAQSLVKDNGYHFYNGAFGEKWFLYTKKLKPQVIGYRFNKNTELKTTELDLSVRPGVIFITQNETSNGTQVHSKQISKLRKKYESHLIAVDATSSMAGIYLDFRNADVWYASVQKCFSLPAGLAVLICSPRAVDRALELNEHSHYNSLPFMINMMGKNQTTHTPNVLAIYLLRRVMEARKPIRKIHETTLNRFNRYMTLINELSLSHLVENDEVRSYTVIPLETDQKQIIALKEQARKQGIILGNGYGDYKKNTVRIANFPAITDSEICALEKFLRS